MEELFYRTRPGFAVHNCQMGSHNCKFDWEVVGTIQGMCLAYNPLVEYPRDDELRITLGGNKSGNSFNIVIFGCLYRKIDFF